MSLKPLLAQLEREPALDALARAAKPTKIFLSGAFAPFVLAGLSESAAAGRPVLIVTPDEQVALEMAHDLQTFLDDRPVRHYPARGVVYESHIAPPPHLVGMRIAALDSLTESGARPPVVVASIAALAEKVPDPELRPHGFRINKGELIDFDELALKLVDLGYDRVDRVQDRGQFAMRGDLLDVFSPTEERAGRIELFDVEVESIREFSTFTQRSLGELDSIELAPAAELAREHREPALAAVGAAGDGEARPDIAPAAGRSFLRVF